MAPPDETRILVPGETCWRIARAGRFALIVDAADYFAIAQAAMRKARHTIILIGWDFDTRIALDPDDGDGEWPNTLGPFINTLVERRPELRVFVLKWDLGVLQTLGRGATPLFVLDWMTDERIHFRLDRAHPLGACHHQKIAVIDDAMAFCGGIDMTVGRWDTRAHEDKDPRRKSPWGFAQDPWHDATAAVDGEAARALGELARERWRHATGEDVPAPESAGDPWPDSLPVVLRDVEVGIARTQPAHEGQAEAREIEALYLAAIRAARRTLYIESQYLASRRIADALRERLAEPGGPEIVIVNPLSTEGWLEEEVMGSARALIAGRLREADGSGRLRLVYPVTESGAPIYVHAKIMIVDDRLLRVGSSNLNNRSMGLDTECDLAIEAPSDDAAMRRTITAIRHDLLAEHLGVTAEAVAAAERAAGGSMVSAVDRLSRAEGRTLRRLDPPAINDLERSLAEKRILDPERPRSVAQQLRRMTR